MVFIACKAPEEEKAAECAERFASCYFNLDFEGASGYCTQESMKWLSFRASNITRRDIDEVNAHHLAATISVNQVELANDTSALVRCTVNNAIAADSLEQEQARMTTRQEWMIPLVKRGKRWWVRMEAPLQNAE